MTGIHSYIQKRKTGVSFTVLLLVCIILILFSNRNMVIKPREVGQSLLSTLQLSIHSISTWFVNTWNSINELKKLRQELDEAREKLLEHERISRDAAELHRENTQLKVQLKFSKALAFKQIPAEVIARDPGNEFSTLMVNKGTMHGVKRGMPVVAFQGGLQGLVGKIVFAGLWTSTIKPITDPSSYVAARLQNSRYDGLVNGRQHYMGGLIMRYIKKSAVEDIQYGDLVITSGMGLLFPKGIHIGRVREMQAKAYEASLELEIEPIVDFSRLEYLFILDTGE